MNAGGLVLAVLALALGCNETAVIDNGGDGGTGGGSCGTGGSGGSGAMGGVGGMAGMGGTGGNAVAYEGSVCPCTEAGIRAAIAQGGGPYTFDCDGPTTVVTEAQITIHNDVTLDGEGKLPVDGNEEHLVFGINDGDATAELRGFGVTNGNGGIAMAVGTLTLTNSTVYGNTAGHSGGGIDNGGTLRLSDSTVSGNVISGNGGGIFNHGSGTLTSSTVSGGGNPESLGHPCGFDQSTGQVDVSAEDLKLGALQDNGPPTHTHALLPGSVAIDQIAQAMCEVDEDQRGAPRPETGGSMCDVGSFEVQP